MCQSVSQFSSHMWHTAQIFLWKKKNLEYQCFPAKCTVSVELKETTGFKQDSLFFRFFLWLKNTVAILPLVQLEIFIVFWPWEIIWRDVAYQNNGEFQNCIKVQMTQKVLV